MTDCRAMKNVPSEARPFERLEKYGSASLTDAELLAVFLRSGTKGHSVLEAASGILALRGGFEGLDTFVDLTVEELESVPGIGHVKALQLSCLSEFCTRVARARSAEKLSVCDPASVAGYYMNPLRFCDREFVHIMLTDTRGGFLRDVQIAAGTVNSASVSPREILREALIHKAAGLFFVHNHPSGCPEPSREDIAFTKRLKESGALLNVPLVDSLIIGSGQYMSFRERGIL